MLVSIVIATRNRPQLLARCVESLRRQTHKEIEIIVVDNDPLDDAREVAERFGARYVVEPRRGLSGARNRGAQLATGEVIAFTDDDVIADERWIESLAAEFEDPRVMAAAGQVLTGDRGDTVWTFSRDAHRLIARDDPQWFEIANFGGIGNGANIAFRRSAFPRFHTRLGLGALIPGFEEHHLFSRVIEEGGAVAATPRAVVHHPAEMHSLRRRLKSRFASAAYFLFLAATQPRHLPRIARYAVEALAGIPRPWRGARASEPLLPFLSACVAAWITYGIVETWIAVILADDRRESIGTTMAMLGAYAAFGAVVGFLLEIIFRERRANSAAFVAVLTVVVIDLAHAVTAPGLGPRSLLPLIAIGAVVAISACAGIFWPRSTPLARVVANSWTASVLLLGPMWLARDALFSQPPRVRSMASALLVAAAILLSAAAMRLHAPTRRSAALALAAITIVVAAIPRATGSASVPPIAKSSRSDIILIVLDTVRADHTSLLGYARDTTPALRAMAGTSFVNAYAPSNMTLTTHASIFTGLPASAHGAHATPDEPYGAPLAPSFETLAEALSARGYDTMAVAANTGYLTPHFGLDQGFSTYECRSRSAYLIRESLFALLARRARTDYQLGEEINREVLRAIRRRRAGRPLFLFVNYMDAHEPYPADAAITDRFLKKRARSSAASIMDRAAVNQPITPLERDSLIAQYDAGIVAVDAAVANLAEQLRQERIWDDALVIVTSDHGEGFGEHGVYGHGATLLQEQIHVPLLIRGPRQRDRRTSLRPTGLIELFQLILGSSGRSLPTPLEQQPPLPLLAETFGPDEAAVIDHGRKFVAAADGQHLYDLVADPAEKRDLGGALRAEVTRMAAMQHALTATRLNAPPGSAVDAETRERLRSLGYLAH
jgi:arylsulfatase A-like enzyme/GT2 family glycosyltransferase